MDNSKEISTKVKLFEDKQVRTIWNSEEEEWYFSVVDVCNILSNSKSNDPSSYWRTLKSRLKKEGSEVVSNCHELKLPASDGKFYKTDTLNTKWLLRLIQSIPSPKAEPFKIWLAELGNERLSEIADPERVIHRGVNYYREKGYPEDWITQRMMSIKIRKELTNEWQKRGIENELDFAILTNEITKAWSGLTIREYKELKNLKKENLRDNMTDMELVLNMLAETATTGLSKKEEPQTFDENKQIAKRGGNIARDARLNYERELGESIITNLNSNDKQALEIKNKRIKKD